MGRRKSIAGSALRGQPIIMLKLACHSVGSQTYIIYNTLSTLFDTPLCIPPSL